MRYVLLLAALGAFNAAAGEPKTFKVLIEGTNQAYEECAVKESEIRDAVAFPLIQTGYKEELSSADFVVYAQVIVVPLDEIRHCAYSLSIRFLTFGMGQPTWATEPDVYTLQLCDRPLAGVTRRQNAGREISEGAERFTKSCIVELKKLS